MGIIENFSEIMHSIDHAVEDTEIWIKSIHYMYDSELKFSIIPII
jgi:hypothetical protein